MFTITGLINGESEHITYHWENGHGKLEGDPMIMFLMRNSLDRKRPIGPVGQPLERDINEPLSVLFMIRECFDTIVSWEGDIPEADSTPEGTFC